MIFKLKKQAPLYVIAYDVSDNKERRRVDELLKGYGFRVQKSVYECRLTRGDKKRLFGELASCEIETGHIRCYPVTNTKVKLIGDAPKGIDDNHIYFIE